MKAGGGGGGGEEDSHVLPFGLLELLHTTKSEIEINSNV